jgi:hypothetical protein
VTDHFATTNSLATKHYWHNESCQSYSQRYYCLWSSCLLSCYVKSSFADHLAYWSTNPQNQMIPSSQAGWGSLEYLSWIPLATYLLTHCSRYAMELRTSKWMASTGLDHKIKGLGEALTYYCLMVTDLK